ncbi:hypothetical protein [Changchengzhania lutea]|uniref:hypothetical protein n=1 Tax=Changchengzhania lutea TaxID=2049305 RepID=UPI00115D1F49|nr:hypothetical protein [Changchengzhania lutea]
MKKILSIFAIMISIVMFTNCSENDDTPAITSIDFVGFESDFQIGVDPTGTASSEVRVAVSQVSGSDRSFNIEVVEDMTTADASAYTVPASVTIPANSNVGTFIVDVVGSNVSSSGDDMLTVEITSQDENLFKSDPISLNLKQVCPYPETFLAITFDSYSEETSWEIYEASDTDNPIYAGEYAAGETDASEKFCLANGTYIFVIYDVYSDGICCNYGDGSYTLTNNGNIIKAGGSFGANEVTEFTLNN